MWSKTRQILKERLANSLKGRVDYHYDVYHDARSKVKRDWHTTEMHVLSIIVDGDAWFCTNPKFYRIKYQKGNSKTDEEIIRETGIVGNIWGLDASWYIHHYLNVLSADKSLTDDNYFIRLLAVLDNRIGKRRLRPLLDNIDNEPEWFRKWIRLRCEAEEMVKTAETQSA